MDKFLKRTFEICNNEQENVPCTSNVVKKQKIVKRQYRKDYIQYGFSWCGDGDAPKSLWFFCEERLANEAMVPSELMRHLNTKHAIHAHENKNYFQWMLSQNKKQECFCEVIFYSLRKSIKSHYHVAKLIACQKITHTIGETIKISMPRNFSNNAWTKRS